MQVTQHNPSWPSCNPEITLLFVREVSKSLRHDLKSISEPSVLKRYLRILIALDHSARKALRDYHQNSKKSDLVESLLQTALRSLRQTQVECDDVEGECIKAAISRKEELALEAKEMECLFASTAVNILHTRQPLNVNKVKECVSQLRCLEVDVDLHARCVQRNGMHKKDCIPVSTAARGYKLLALPGLPVNLLIVASTRIGI
jgi:hypothetical protein